MLERCLLAGLIVMVWGCVYFAWRYAQADAKSLSSRGIGFGLFLYIVFCLFGAWRSVSAWHDTTLVWSEEPEQYHVVLVGTPHVGERWVGVDAMMLESRGRVKNPIVRLMLQRDSVSECLRVGEAITFKAEVQSLRHRDDSDVPFDYARYLSVKGVSGQAFLYERCWNLNSSEVENDYPLMTRLKIGALKVRDSLLDIYKEVGLSGTSFALFSALTLGDKAELDDEVKTLYADVGVTHVLALSGMHLSFFVAVFNLLLLRFCRRMATRVAGVALVLSFIWGYALVSGLPPSMVRASIMYSLMLMGTLLGRDGFSVNSLGVSAVLMLTISPLLLYDVGFRLSFLSMLGILLIYPMFINRRIMQWRYTKWLMQSLLISFAAQLFTIPLVAYTFNTFAPYSALATLLITPLTAIQLYLMPVLLLVMDVNILIQPLVVVVDWLIRIQNGVLHLISDFPFSVVSVRCSLLTMHAFYLLLAVLLMRGDIRLVTWLKCLLLSLIIFFLTLFY